MKRTLRQLLRFAIVGVASNTLGYLGYLALTALSVEAKTAMSLIYLAAIGASFALNRRWTFAHTGGAPRTFFPYLAIYLAGYALNLAGLMYFADHLGLDHRIVQGCLVLGIAALMFVLQKFWIFRVPSSCRTSS